MYETRWSLQLAEFRNPENIYTVLAIANIFSDEDKAKIFTLLRNRLPEMGVVFTTQGEICWVLDGQGFRCRCTEEDLNLAVVLRNIAPPKEWYYERKDLIQYSEKEMFLKFGLKEKNVFAVVEILDYIVYAITRKDNVTLHNLSGKTRKTSFVKDRNGHVCNVKRNDRICPIPRIRYVCKVNVASQFLVLPIFRLGTTDFYHDGVVTNLSKQNISGSRRRIRWRSIWQTRL